MSTEALIIDLSKDPFNHELNFAVAEEYLRLNQTASAVSFYLRCAEYSKETNELAYSSLLRMAQCFENQTGRDISVLNNLMQALAYMDDRPEAYFFLSQYYEKLNAWQEAYTFATLGLGWSYINPLPVDLGYYGSYCLEFQMAVAAWWIGRKEESLTTLHRLATLDLHPAYKNAVINNLERLNALL